MPEQKIIKVTLQNEEDLLLARHEVRKIVKEMGFNLVDQTRIITAVSELTRNALIHGGGGNIKVNRLKSPREGVEVIIEDKGKGIADIELALEEGYSTGNGLGNGLGGSRRLMDNFEISSEVGFGTKVRAIKWLD